MEEENKEPVTKLDITLHDKSQDMTDANIKLDRNVYQAEEQSFNEINGDFMKSPLDDMHHGKSQDTNDSKFEFQNL